MATIANNKVLNVGDVVLVKVLSQIPDTYVPSIITEREINNKNVQCKGIDIKDSTFTNIGFTKNNGTFVYEKEGIRVTAYKSTDSSYMLLYDTKGGCSGWTCNFVHDIQHFFRFKGMSEKAEETGKVIYQTLDFTYKDDLNGDK